MLRAQLSLSGHPHERRIMDRNDNIRVLVVDGGGSDSATEELRQTLNMARDIIVVGEVNSGEEALETARYTSPDVIVLFADSDLSGMDSIQTTRAINTEGLSAGVVIVTENIALNLAPAVKARAAGLFSPGNVAEELLSTIYRIHQWSPYSLSLQ